MIFRRSAELRGKDIGEGRGSSGQPRACHPAFLLASRTPAPGPSAPLTGEAKKTYNLLFQAGRRGTDTLFGITWFCSYEPSASHQSQSSTLSIAPPIPTKRSLDFS